MLFKAIDPHKKDLQFVEASALDLTRHLRLLPLSLLLHSSPPPPACQHIAEEEEEEVIAG